MQKWEYISKYDCTDEELNKCGAEGWELVSVASLVKQETYDGEMGTVFTSLDFYFKRPLEEKTDAVHGTR